MPRLVRETGGRASVDDERWAESLIRDLERRGIDYVARGIGVFPVEAATGYPLRNGRFRDEQSGFGEYVSRRPNETIDTLTPAELVGDSWWTGYAEAVFDTVEEARNYAENLVKEAYFGRPGYPVLIAANSMNDAEAFSVRLHAAGVEHALLTAKNIENAADVFATAGFRKKVTVTSIRLRDQEVILGRDPAEKAVLNVEGGGLHTILLGTPTSRRAEQHGRLRTGSSGDHGMTWVVRSPQDPPAPQPADVDVLVFSD